MHSANPLSQIRISSETPHCLITVEKCACPFWLLFVFFQCFEEHYSDFQSNQLQRGQNGPARLLIIRSNMVQTHLRVSFNFIRWLTNMQTQFIQNLQNCAKALKHMKTEDLKLFIWVVSVYDGSIFTEQINTDINMHFQSSPWGSPVIPVQVNFIKINQVSCWWNWTNQISHVQITFKFVSSFMFKAIFLSGKCVV